MSRTRFAALATIGCLMLGSSAATADRPQGDVSIGLGIAALTGSAVQDWYGSNGYNISAGYRVGKGWKDEQTISLSYLKSSGKSFGAGATRFDSWLTGWTIGLTLRKRPTEENKLYFGYGGGLSLLGEKSSTNGFTTSRDTNPALEVHGVGGVALSDAVRLEIGYTQFLSSIHNPVTGDSSAAGGAFTFSMEGRF